MRDLPKDTLRILGCSHILITDRTADPRWPLPYRPYCKATCQLLPHKFAWKYEGCRAQPARWEQ